MDPRRFSSVADRLALVEAVAAGHSLRRASAALDVRERGWHRDGEDIGRREQAS